jgi:hypothetical protein
MDMSREFPSDFDPLGAEQVAPPQDVAAAIGTDERRMHVRAYNYWVSLLAGRDFPSIEDLEPGDVEDFVGHSVLLDFTCGGENPALPYIGAAIRDEGGLDDGMRTISDVPSRSLLSRLTDHYMQIIANRAPVGFEAEFENQRGENICYRGILMPFSSDGDTIDFIYGVINWKAVGDEAGRLPVRAIVEIEPAAGELVPEPEGIVAEEPADPAPVPHFAWEDAPPADEDAIETPDISLEETAGLADRLWAARETADAMKAGEGRTRAALYKALALAYDFAVAARDNPQDYAELLEESGMKAQARAPMTPIVKLVFGVDYDKARLTEFAAALSHAQREGVELGAFQAFIEGQSGGLKALVAAERTARRPEPREDGRAETARRLLRNAPVIELADVPAEQEFAVIVTRRGPDGRHEPVAVIDDAALVERVIRRAA